MQELTHVAKQTLQNLAQRYRVSDDAVRALLSAVAAGGGTMAQFYHPELGGGGQWMQGGMTMVGDMFNQGLQATVSGLCSELSGLLASQQVFVPAPQQTSSGFIARGNAWWPPELGSPSSSGGQNDARYAYFPHAQRLAIDRAGHVTVYDTLDHHIGGVQQQQGGPYGSLSFSSQRGTFTVDSLPVVSPALHQSSPVYQAPPPVQPAYYQPVQSAPSAPSGEAQGQEAILAALERLGALHQQGVLSDEEFRAKKSELLARL